MAWSGLGGDEGKAAKATLLAFFFSNTIPGPANSETSHSHLTPYHISLRLSLPR